MGTFKCKEHGVQYSEYAVLRCPACGEAVEWTNLPQARSVDELRREQRWIRWRPWCKGALFIAFIGLITMVGFIVFKDVSKTVNSMPIVVSKSPRFPMSRADAEMLSNFEKLHWVELQPTRHRALVLSIAWASLDANGKEDLAFLLAKASAASNGVENYKIELVDMNSAASLATWEWSPWSGVHFDVR